MRGVGPVAHGAIDLGGQDEFLAASAALRQPPANELLGEALAPPAFTQLVAIGVGGIEKIEAGCKRPVHDQAAVRLRSERSEVSSFRDTNGSPSIRNVPNAHIA